MRRNKTSKDMLLFMGALIFSVALMFAFIELPRWIDSLLQERAGFPGFDQGSGDEAAFLSDLFIDALYLRWIGYASLILVVIFILMGFITRKSGWGWAGAFVIFLPVFGQFALSMFFLSGLGILRTGWLPFIESGFPILDLGKVIYLPFWILMWFFGLFNWHAYDFTCWLFMSVGAFLFVWGVFVWLQSRFGGSGVATGWIYKISRHPQYLGWIIWSYGLMMFSMTENVMKKSWGFGSSFPWLIMTMIIIAICMIEELSMRDKYGEAYDDYRERTPFLFPLPKWLKRLVKAPMKLVTKNRFPTNRKQVAGITITYTIIFMAISLIWVDFGDDTAGRFGSAGHPEHLIDSLINEISITSERREVYHHFKALGQVGKPARPALINYLHDSDPVKREFAANQLGRLQDTAAVIPLIEALEDDYWRVQTGVVLALAEIGDHRAIKPVIEFLRQVPQNSRDRFYAALGNLKAEEAWPLLVNGTHDEKWYARTSALRALSEINLERALPYVYEALEDSLVQVRRNAVFILLEKKPPGSVPHLERVLEDPDFETRFYASQAINLIEVK